MILVTGPTGSGKTVSLYTGLNILNTEDCNISTAEDPAEINLPGINQVNVNTKVGLTFAAALRAFLRQDPDVIMVGEIRDLETAEIAHQGRADRPPGALDAAHQRCAADPDAPGRHGRQAVRDRDLGEPDHRAAPGAQAVRALQAADRRSGRGAAQGRLRGDGHRHRHPGLPRRWAAASCTDGYKGRVGIYQVMPVTEAIGRIIMAGGSAIDIADQAAKEGIWDLRRSGLEKVKTGLTSLEEINSVTIE